MFHPPDSPAPPAPALLDYKLPDGLLRAREAALLPLRPSLRAPGRDLRASKFYLLRALTLAEAPLAQMEAARRSGLQIGESEAKVKRLAEALVAERLAAWTHESGWRFRRLAASRIGRRLVETIARETAARGPARWEALADRPEEGRFTAPMRTRLFQLLARLRRASMREPVLDGVNTPELAGEDLPFGLPLQLRLTRGALVQRLRVPLRHYGFNEAQWRVLRILGGQPGLAWTFNALTRRGCFHWGAPNVSHALFYLSQRGLIEREKIGGTLDNWQPRKRWRAVISRNGRDIIAMVEQRVHQDCADLFARLGGDEMAALDRLLGRLTGALLWREGAAPEDQEAHPFGAEYDRIDALTRVRSRAQTKKKTLYRQNRIPMPRRRVTRWYE